MKIAPHFVVGLTSVAALTAGAILAAEDRALFDPQQMMLTVLSDSPTMQLPMGFVHRDARSGAPVASRPRH